MTTSFGMQDTTRLLYNRNVSSSTLLADATPEQLPDPVRHEGPIIKFHRCKPVMLLLVVHRPAVQQAPICRHMWHC